MSSEQDAKARFVEFLKRDIEVWLLGNPHRHGEAFEQMEDIGLTWSDRQLDVAYTFYEAWIDEVGHGFPRFYPGIEPGDWPALGQQVVDVLEGSSAQFPPIVEAHFNLNKTKKTITPLSEWDRKSTLVIYWGVMAFLISELFYQPFFPTFILTMATVVTYAWFRQKNL